jgi:hypothetical protein
MDGRQVIKRFAVEVYFFLFTLFIALALLDTLRAIQQDVVIGRRPGWLLGAAVVFAVFSLVATEVRDRRLYNQQSS